MSKKEMIMLTFRATVFYSSPRNLNKIIYEHKKDFKSGNTNNSLVSHNITTNHTFYFQNSIIFAFIHDRDKNRIISFW